MTLKKEILLILKKDLKNIIIGFILVGLTVALDVVQPLITKVIIDNGLSEKNFSVITSMGYVLFFAIISKMLLDYLGNVTILKVTRNFLSRINTVMIMSLFNKNRTFYSNNSNGEIIEKTMEVWNLEDSISSNTIYSLISIVNLFITAAILFSYSIPITIFIIVVSLVLLLIIKRQAKKLKNSSEQYYKSSGKIFNELSESVYGMEEIINLNEKNFFETRFLKSVEEKLFSFAKFSKTRFLTSNLVSGVTSLMYLCVLVFIGYSITFKNNMTIGTYTLILSYSSKIITPILDIGNIISEIQPLKVMYSRIKDIVENDNVESSSDLVTIISSKIRNLTVENLSFSYNKNKTILKNINMCFHSGEITLIKGDNGIGKSTLFRLLLKNYTEYTGVIKIDNQDIVNIDTSSIIYQALQNPFIFNMSIRENIILDQNYEIEKYKRVIEILKLNQVFTENDLYNDSIIEENGKSLSGGQIRLIEIARILYRNSKIILLDEITANLDKHMCKIIVDGVKQLSKEKIVIIIEHSNIFDFIATQIYELKGD